MIQVEVWQRVEIAALCAVTVAAIASPLAEWSVWFSWTLLSVQAVTLIHVATWLVPLLRSVNRTNSG